MRILIMATPVAPLGQGKTGGVTAHIANTVEALKLYGHTADVMAMEGSRTLGVTPIQIAGNPQPSLASETGEEIYPIPAGGVLAAMWHEAYRRQDDYDIILNFAHDWLPYYLTPFFPTEVYHIVNMTDVNEPTSAEIVSLANRSRGRVAFMTDAQAERFSGLNDPPIVSFGLDLSVYEYTEAHQDALIWAGRISPEKGLEDAASAAEKLGRKLIVAGAIDDETYWSDLQSRYGSTFDYKGFLSTRELQALMGTALALLQSQKWHEAFGIVTIEAMACGTPVIGYARGANKELISNGESGILVAPDNIDALIDAVGAAGSLSRQDCRDYVVRNYSLNSYGARLDAWLNAGAVKQ